MMFRSDKISTVILCAIGFCIFVSSAQAKSPLGDALSLEKASLQPVFRDRMVTGNHMLKEEGPSDENQSPAFSLIAIARSWLAGQVDATVALLSEGLRDPEYSLSLHIGMAKALAEIGTPAAIQALVAVYVDPGTDADFRAGVEDALVQAGESSVRPILETLVAGSVYNTEADVGIEDNNICLSSGGRVALSGGHSSRNITSNRIDDEQGSTGITNNQAQLRADFRRILVAIGNSAVEPLSAIVRDNTNSRVLRDESIWALGQIGTPEAAEGLINIITDDRYDTETRVNAVVELALIHDPAATRGLLVALGEENVEVSLKALTFLSVTRDRDVAAQVNESTAVFLRAALANSEHSVRQYARQLLVERFGNTAIRDYLTERMQNENDPVVRQYLNESLVETEEAVTIIEGIVQTYGISVDDTFDVTQLRAILGTLQLFPVDQSRGLSRIEYDPEYAGVYDGFYSGGPLWFNPAVTINDYTTQILIHELGHFFDDKYFDSGAFRDLYDRDAPTEEFAKELGGLIKKNVREDFATTYEAYFLDSKASFQVAIDRAQAGNSVYLEKLLFVLDFTTEYHPEYATIYRIVGNSVNQMSLSVTRDYSGAITHIEGVSVTDLDGLEELFSGLYF